MHPRRELRSLRVLLCATLAAAWLPAPATAQTHGTPVAAPADTSVARSEAPLSEARELVKSGDYDRAIEILKPVIERSRSRIDEQRDAYLLLIKTHVFLANDLKFKAQGKVSSDLNYDEARKRIAECLAIKELRHTRPEPASEYPPEMVSLFAEVRGQTLGAFRISSLVPRDAVVLFDSDTLRAMPGDTLLGDTDIPIGQHRVVASHERYRDLTEEVTISPGATLERPYELSKRRSGLWYATWITAGVGAVVGLVAALTHGGNTTQEPLPGAPPPPAGRTPDSRPVTYGR
jgi:hypothetical protein